MHGALNPEMYSYRVNSSDSNLSLTFRAKTMIPISNLGNKYIFSFCQSPRPIDTEMIIASHVTDRPTKVKVTFSIQGNITHDGKTYVNGDSLHFNIRALETVSLKSKFDLTGTTITSNSTVAVFVRGKENGFSVPFEQLIPVSHFGNNYVVATGDAIEHYQLQIIGEHNDTIITFNNGTQVILENRPSQGRMPSFLQDVGANANFHFTSSKPVTVILCNLDLNQDPLDLVVVPPVAFYTRYPLVMTMYRVCKFMTENAETPRVEGDSVDITKSLPYQLAWEKIPNSTFRIGTFVSSSKTPFQLNFTGKVGVLCFSVSNIHTSGFGKIAASNDAQHGIEFIIPTGFRGIIIFRNHDRNGYLEIKKSIPSNTFNRIFLFTRDSDKCIMLSDELSSLNLYGIIDYSYFSMIPVSALGSRYVISSCYPLSNKTTVWLITTHDKATEVDITFTVDEAFTYDGNTYYDGDVLSLSLSSCSTVSIILNNDATGTMIQAKNAPIAVFSGTVSEDLTRVESLEQLLPVNQHGTEHVIDVPPNEGPLLQIVSEHQNAEVTFNHEESISLGNTSRFNRKLNESEAVVLTSSHPVMATLCRERGFVVIPPVHTYRHAHSINFFTSGSAIIKIFMDGIGTNNLKISNAGDILLENVSEYRVGTQQRSFPPEVHISSLDKFAVLYFKSFGDLLNGGYNFSKEPYEKVPPPTLDDDWSIYGIGAGTGVCTATAMAFGGFAYMRRRRRQEAERSNRERRQSQVDRQVRPPHPGPDKSPPVFKV